MFLCSVSLLRALIHRFFRLISGLQAHIHGFYTLLAFSTAFSGHQGMIGAVCMPVWPGLRHIPSTYLSSGSLSAQLLMFGALLSLHLFLRVEGVILRLSFVAVGCS